MVKLVIFDLDGTLLDTIADLANATNYALRTCGFPEHGAEAYKLFVGNGINKLFQRSLPQGVKTEENILRVREAFLPYYENHNTEYTTPYPGICELLDMLQDMGIMLAVASNKYNAATKKLAAHYFPGIKFVQVLGQRTRVAPKPDPAIVNDIINTARVKREEVLYVGDSGVDMQTAANAGIRSVGVTWGFRPRKELEEYSPYCIVDSPREIMSLIVR